MNKSSKQFLFSLLETPSPSGFEQQIQEIVRKYMSQFADDISTDIHGNVAVILNPKATTKVMLAGHCDQIGMMVRFISEEGYIYFYPLGGLDKRTLWGSKVLISGITKPILGVIGKQPIHSEKPIDRDKGVDAIEDMWIDIGAKNREDALKVVEVGAPIVFYPEVKELLNNYITGPGLDNRVGLWVIMEALRLVAGKSKVGVYAVSTVQEEVGLRGATTATFGIEPLVGIAVDVTHASDNPGKVSSTCTQCKLLKGPCIYTGPNINPMVQSMLKECAKKEDIEIQILPAARPLGNDANTIQLSRSGVATASIGIPNRYMHTQCEVVNLTDLENSAKLIARFLTTVTPKTNFIPIFK
jgi:tetrahedral aminopeptidase